jgi:hypothetical protein
LDDATYIREKLDRIAEDAAHTRGQLDEVIPAYNKRLDDQHATVQDLAKRMAAHDQKHARAEGFFAVGKLALAGTASAFTLGVKLIYENWTDIFSATK